MRRPSPRWIGSTTLIAAAFLTACAEVPNPVEPTGMRAVSPAAASAVFSGRLFGISGARGAPSSLYLINRTTGASTLIGATGYNHIAAMDFDPTTGVLYGVANGSGVGPPETLVTIDVNTGAATFVATVSWPPGLCGSANNVPDMTFNSAGVLYGWRDPCDDDLYIIDKATGAATRVGESFMGTAQFGLAFNSADQLFGKVSNTVYSINTTTGQGTFHSSIFQFLQNMLAFDENDVAWSGNRNAGSPIYTFNINGGPATLVGHTNIPFLAALAFERISNQPPVCSAAAATVTELWPPDHSMRTVGIGGVTDPDGDAITITITGIMQDEPVNGLGDGDTAPDATGVGAASAELRAERSGTGNGRVYVIAFSASDGKGGTCTGAVSVGVRHSQGKGPKGGPAVNDGATHVSTAP
jgi:hypothetical protein